ncbi:uncharacterized protein [Rutidosis leptorrhynchoides]|uniref:uncharacterized protein n=1 Tax=Rutidosis leptorrhynchoides TaxID=125765 RepID=UPI003A9968BC
MAYDNDDKIDDMLRMMRKVPASVASAIKEQFTLDEVASVIKGFDGNKTLGPDGFSLLFFKKGWHFLEENVMDMFHQFHDNPSFPKGFNSSFIVLIPKSNSARIMDQMRPISLINAPYKILAKTIANRMKLAIPSIISENQNGFVPTRLLMDGVMVVNEVVHMAKSKKKPIVLIKIDFSKAYDCVSHEFLLLVLQKMGFGSRFISWIATSEILSKLLSRDLANGFLEDVKFGSDLTINHSQFADDTISFAQPNSRELNRIKYIMGLFFQLSGLHMNAIKTTLYGIHVSKEDMINFSSIFECKVGSFPLEYLGIPIGFSSNRIDMWDPIVNKFKKKLAGWKGRCLSFDGRLVIVNAVISNLPIHYMSIYKAPVEACLPKELGGLGITPLRIKNLAMLAKWWGKFNNNKPCLWKSIVTSSFGSSFGNNLAHSVFSSHVSQASPIWKDLIRLQQDPLSQGIVGSNVWKWKVGNGVKILFWHDIWLDNVSLKDRFPTLFESSRSPLITVSQCFLCNAYSVPQYSEGNLAFNCPLSLYNSYKAQELGSLLACVSLNVLVDDKLCWSSSTDGEYSVSNAIRIMVQSSQVTPPIWTKVVWSNNIPSKVMLFHWLAIQNSIPVYDILIKRHILPSSHSNLCIWCLEEVETVNHLLFLCKWSFKIWSNLFRWWNFVWVIPGSIEAFSFDWFHGIGALPSKWRPKVTAIDASKDLEKLSLDEFIENLKFHEVILDKDEEADKVKKEKKSIALKAKASEEGEYEEDEDDILNDDEQLAFIV